MIKAFGESLEAPPLHQWYQLTNGEKINCSEEIINKLWCNWLYGENGIRADIEGYTVFEFINPIGIDVLNKEAWLKVYCDYGLES
jgi:hypothetical protein